MNDLACLPWRDGSGDFDFALLDTPLAERVRAHAAAAPDAVAIAEPARAIRYGAFWQEVERRIGALARIPDDGTPVGVLLPSGIEQAASVLACAAAGRICFPLDPSAPLPRTAELMAASGARAAFGDASLLPPTCRAIEVIDAAGTAVAPVLQTAPAFISATSGSSGEPKLVVHHQRAWSFNAWGFVDVFGMTAEDRHVFTGAPNSFTAMIHAVAALLVGGTLLVCDLRVHGLAALLDLMARHRATILRGAPTLLRTLSRLPGADAAFGSLRAVRLVGEALPAADVPPLRALLPPGALLVHAWGATEAIPFEYALPADLPPESSIVPCGRLRPGAAFCIIDNDGNPCPDGTSGELVMRSRYNAMGEWQGGRCVAGRMVPDAADPEATIYRTGDMATVRPDGLLAVQGRRDREVKVNGMRVDLLEIEAAIRSCAGVAHAAVIAAGDGARSELCAFLVGSADTRHVRQALTARFPPYMVPARFMVVAELPRMTSGKTDHRALHLLLQRAPATSP